MIGPKAIVGFVFVILGLVFTAAFANLSYHSIQTASRGLEAQGTVIGERKTSGGYRGGRSHRPVVSFVDEQGRTHIFEQRPGGRKGAYDIGEKVGVLYRANEPDTAIIDSFWGRYGHVFGMIFALFFVFFGAWMIRWDRRENAIFDR